MKQDFTYSLKNTYGGARPQARTFRLPKPPPEKSFVSVFRIVLEAYDEIKKTLGTFPAETGGLLLGDPYTGLITDFLFDADARTSGSIYYPTVEFLNREIPRYEALGKHPLGIAHSHPVGIIRPSGPDMSAAYSNITSPHNQHLKTWHMPIIQSIGDVKSFEFHPYIVSCGGEPGETILHMPELEIVDRNGMLVSKKKSSFQTKIAKPKEQTTKAGDNLNGNYPLEDHFKITKATLERLNDLYVRIAGQVDFAKMLDTSIIHVGAGASSTTIEQFSRIGIKRWIMFDHDTVEKKNLVAQDFEISDIGKLKVNALKERMERCEFEKDAKDVPPLKIGTFEDFLTPDDFMLDALIEREKKTYGRVILVAATDYHPAQARAARLGIRHGITTFFIGAYRDGLAGEIIFYNPKAKEMACYRCIAASRYKAFDSKRADAQGAAKSSGLPFCIGVLDSQLAHLIVGCIHNEVQDGGAPIVNSGHKPSKNLHGDLFLQLLSENRNFIQTQLNPSYRMAGEDIFRDENGVHGKNVKTFISMFQQDPKNPNCPDCASPAAWKHSDYRKDYKTS